MLFRSEVTIKIDEHGIAADVVCIYLKWPTFIIYLAANLPFSLPNSSNVFFQGIELELCKNMMLNQCSQKLPNLHEN